MASALRIFLTEPFFAGSHKAWALGLQAHSRHAVDILSLPGHYWKWRMHGGAVTLARKFHTHEASPDLILATDMLDLPLFLALIRKNHSRVPVALYMHENQLTYPWSPTDRDIMHKRDHHYAFINYASALAADRVFFNSAYHRDAFLGELPAFLRSFPDHHELATVKDLEKKSEVLDLALDLSRLDAFRTEKAKRPAILWNHRWEFDKNPETFFSILYRLSGEGMEFDLVVLGENYHHRPGIFDEAREKLAGHIVHWGYVESPDEYARWLWRCHILPVTSNQDFFGISAVEAMYCGCHPLLPNRLAFLGHIPENAGKDFLYEDDTQLYACLKQLLGEPSAIRLHACRAFAEKYDWAANATVYDEKLAALAEDKG